MRNWLKDSPSKGRLKENWGALFPYIFLYCEKNKSTQPFSGEFKI